MPPIKFHTKHIFPNFHILKINGIMSICNLFMERPSYKYKYLKLILKYSLGTRRRFYTVYIGSQFDSESLLRQQSSSSSVSTDKRRRTWLSYVDWHHWMLDIAFSDLHALIGWLFHARRQTTVTAAFLSTAPQCGTVCRTTCGQRTCR